MSYPFGYLDDMAQREIRRTALKALAIPGYQTPYASREMPMGRGFGTGGLQLSLSLLGPSDVLKVIDQGCDHSVNAVNMKQFITQVCPGVTKTTATPEATVIQSRHRIPETPLSEQHILVLQVPYPDPLVIVEPEGALRKTMHGERDYAALYTKLYEDIATYDEITLSHRYPTAINGHYIIDPSPIPRFDVPKMDHSPAPILLGAGREKRIYAIAPYSDAEPLSFTDVTFRLEAFAAPDGSRLACDICAAVDSYLDERKTDDGKTRYTCSDTEYCTRRAAARADGAALTAMARQQPGGQP